MIVSCGEALIDMVPNPVPGGGPMNVAIAAARLGAPAAFAGSLSSDDHGRLLRRHLVDNGVDVRFVTEVDAPTALAFVEHDPVLRFRFEGDDTADTHYRPEAEQDPSLGLVDDRHHILHGGTLGMFRGTPADTLAGLAGTGRDAGGIVSLDVNIRPQIIDDPDRWHHYHGRWLAHTDLYKGSDEDLDWIWPGRAPESVAEELLAEGHVSAVIVTRGGDGLTVITENGEAAAAPSPVDVVDTVGAGDTIVGAMLTQIHEDFVVAWDRGQLPASWHLDQVALADWQRIAENAVAAAAVTVSRAGADVPHRHDVSW
ncbi:MAG: PfkB family carbohydrate kinase [Ilumatobacter sp.]